MHFLIMIFPLLVSGVRVGRARAGCPCSSRVMAVVWNYFSRHRLLAGNRPAIICMGSTVVVPVLASLQLGDG